MQTGRVYSVSVTGLSLSAAGCVILLAPGDDKPLWVLSATLNQEESEASEQLGVAFFRTSASGTPAATLANGTDVNPVNPNDPAASFVVTRGLFSVAPTKAPTGAVAASEAFNTLSGFRYVPVPEERLMIRQAEPTGLFLESAPAVTTPLFWRLMLNVLEV